MPDLQVEIAIEADRWGEALDDPEAFCATALAAAAAAENAHGAVSVLLADDEAVRALNARFRGLDKPTNVLSFPAIGGEDFLGDIALALETLEQEAHVQEKSLKAHCAHLLVHGFLHLLGYDHDTDETAERMEAQERLILARLGYPDPYRLSPEGRELER